MPTGQNQAHTQDWGAVNVGRSSRPSAKAVTGVAKRYGQSNASAHSGGIMSARKVRCFHNVSFGRLR